MGFSALIRGVKPSAESRGDRRVSVRVYIPTPYRQFTGGAAQVEAQAATVGELLSVLARRYDGLGDRILNGDGSIPGHLNVYVNRQEIRSLQGAETPLRDGDDVALIPAMAGGSGQTLQAPLLTEEQLERYSRHIRLPEVGLEGQRKLLDSRVLVVGAGGLGSPASIYLAAAGVGTIGVVDADVVDRSNLQRQILHFDRDLGRPKTRSARRHLEDLNPDVRVIEHRTLITSDNALEIIKDYDLVVNGCDNFPTRYLLNDACVLLKKPLVDAAILRFEGQATVFLPGRGCYRCLFPQPPPPGTVPSCAQAGIIGALAGHMGTLQAIEAIKVLLGIGEPLASRLLLYDALTAEYQVLNWARNRDCPVCGDRPTITGLIDYEEFCGLPGRRHAQAEAATPAVADKPWARWDLPPAEVKERLDRGEIAVVDVREAWELAALGKIPGSRSIPMNSVPERLAELDPGRDTVFVCNVGERSGSVVEKLRRAGFDRAYNLKGGIFAWLNHRLPVEFEPDQAQEGNGKG